MPCYYPIQAYPASQPNAKGKRPLSFTRPAGKNVESVAIPCGQCIGCRIEKSRQWALRCVHEAQMHNNNSFITLTYKITEQPPFGSLKLDHFQKFMKRFRKAVAPTKIRFFACGEYGENLENSLNGKLGHPHFHACIFGYDFPDRELWQVRDGIRLYRSKLLERLWPYGYSSIGDVTYQSAAYTARYVMKKHLGKHADFYDMIDPHSGEIEKLKPEFTVMSRRPGIGKSWYDKYKSDLRKDFITSAGTKMKPPRYYDNLLENEDPEKLEEVKKLRKERAEARMSDDYFDRLEAGHQIKTKAIQNLKRSLQNEN